MAKKLDELRVKLLNAQFDLQQADFSVLMLFAGNDRIGINETVEKLHEWMDVRYIDTRVFLKPSEEELQRPRFWRYWRGLPQHGRIGIHLGAWALASIADRRTIGDFGFKQRIEHAKQFEQCLHDDGTLILKYWMEIDKDELRQKLSQDETHEWMVEETDWKAYERFEETADAARVYLKETENPLFPWNFVKSGEAKQVATHILGALESRLSKKPKKKKEPLPKAADTLAKVDLSSKLEKDIYKKELARLQRQVAQLSVEARKRGQTTIIVLEGWDAAGKGGVIRRLTQPQAIRDYRIIPISAPSSEEKLYHYLWRFWNALPRSGTMLIFDRSYYGRVLVERVEGFATEEEWSRAYREINDFEAQLVEYGYNVIKFLLHLSSEEQLRRFEEREKTPYKKYKITEEDYRNRQNWEDYQVAYNDMLQHTDTALAPWNVISSEQKRWARIQVLEKVAGELRKAL